MFVAADSCRKNAYVPIMDGSVLEADACLPDRGRVVAANLARIRPTDARRRQRIRLPGASDLVVILLITSYAAFFSAYSLARHRAFLTMGFDLGNANQTVWSTVQGRILQQTNAPGYDIRLGTHFEPILLLISPLYLMHSGPETLLVLQSLALALSAWPIHRLTGRRLSSAWCGTFFALTFLLLPTVQAANVFGFHAVTLAPAFLAWALWLLEEERYGCFVVWALLAMSCREEIPLIVGLMGLRLLVRGRKKLGIAIIFIGVAWTVLALLVIIPQFNVGDTSPQMGRYEHLGRNTGEMMVNLVSQPDLFFSTLTQPTKMRFLLSLFFPTGFLAALAPQLLLLAAPSFAVNLLSNYPPALLLSRFHYNVLVAPFLIIASAYGLATLLQVLDRLFAHVGRRFLLVTLCGYIIVPTLFYHYVNGQTPLARGFAWPRVGEHERIGHRLIERIPADAAVSAHNQLNPHLTQRKNVYVFPRLEDADFVLVDVTVDVTALPYQEPVRGFAEIQELLANPEFGVAAAKDGFILFQRGVGNRGVPEAFYSAFQVPGDTASAYYPPQAAFRHGPALSDVSWRTDEKGILTIETIWLRRTEAVTDGKIAVQLIQSPGDWVAGECEELNLTLWNPPQQWPLRRPVRDVARLVLPRDVAAEDLQISLIYRTPSGKRNTVKLTKPGDWQVDKSGTMLLIPLDKPMS